MLELFSLKLSAPKRLPYLLALKLKDCGIVLLFAQEEIELTYVYENIMKGK